MSDTRLCVGVIGCGGMARNHVRHLWNVRLYDPDGYRIEFASDADVPEGTVFSEGL